MRLPFPRLELIPALLAVFFLFHLRVCVHAHQEACSNFPADGDPQKLQGRVTQPDTRPWIVLAWISCEDSASDPAPLRTCEGALIRRDWVVTAASCFRCGSAASVVVDVGLYSSDIRAEILGDRKVERIGVDKVFLAPRYVYPQRKNDVAILHLSKSVNNESRTIALMDCGEGIGVNAELGTTGFSSGWGATPTQSTLEPKPLYDAHVCLWPAEVCERSAGQSTNGMLCAGAKEYPEFLAPNATQMDLSGGLQGRRELVEEAETSAPCFVEAGSPLVVGFAKEEEGVSKGGELLVSCHWKLCGVLSFGMHCTNSDIPGFYTNICNHRDWIEKTIRVENGMNHLNLIPTLLKMGRYYNTTMRHYWDMSVK